jgi:hypothetical protein
MQNNTVMCGFTEEETEEISHFELFPFTERTSEEKCTLTLCITCKGNRMAFTMRNSEEKGKKIKNVFMPLIYVNLSPTNQKGISVGNLI